MNCRAYEMYNENEYFLKYLSIHPLLRYSTKQNDINKKIFQIYLLDKFNKEEITYDDLKNKYQIIIDIENNNKKLMAELQYKHKSLEDSYNEINNNNLNNIYKLFMK